jgi:phosphatidylserine/phosphatidylglycerophosphate/cardiolipin synthase-like enzyme
MFLSASPARTPLAASRALRSRVGVDRASRVRARLPSRALVSRARVEPRVLEDDAHARRRANAVSVASPPDAMREERRRALSGGSVDGSIDDDGDVVPAREMTSRTRSPAPREPPVRLLTHYDAVVDCIVHEMDRTAAGDRVEFSVYVLEPGESTLRVLAAMRRAAGRGVRVDCSLDCSVISAFTRWCEGTETWAGKLEALAAEFPALVTFAPRVVPTHAKYVMCHRATAVPTAVFGGVNIGDRFRDWRDFAIRCEGRAAVGALALSVNGPVAGADADDGRRDVAGGDARLRPENNVVVGGARAGAGARPGAGTRTRENASRGFSSKDTTLSVSPGTSPGTKHLPRAVAEASAAARDFARRRVARTVGSRYRDASSDEAARAGGLGFITNRPTGFDVVAWAAPWWRTFPGAFDVYPALLRLMRDERYDEYLVAAAYVDQAGSAVLADALDRGAAVTLVMPRRPNVYEDANKKALAKLMARHGARPGETKTREGRRLRAFACDDMLHAKVFSARSSRGTAPDAAMVGSCNLKRRSFGQFAELNALIAQPSCTRQLRRELEKLVGMSEEIFRGDPFLDFAEPKATVEEWLG